MATSPSQSEAQLVALPGDESNLSSLVYDLSQQLNGAMENMLKMISEIDQNSAGITEDIEKCKEVVSERKNELAEEKEQFQKAAYAVLDMLSNGV